MPKKAINLVKILGARSFEQVKEWLRQAGYNLDSGSFSPLSEIDDKTIEKLMEIAGSTEAPPKPKPVGKKIKRAVGESDLQQPTPRLKEIIAKTAVVQKADTRTEPIVVGAEAVATRLKPIVEEEKRKPKVKLEKAKKREKEAVEVPKEEVEVEETPEGEEGKIVEPELTEEEELEEALRFKRERRQAIAQALRSRPRPRERRPTKAIKEIISEEEGVVTSRKRVFKLKGIKRKEPTTEVHRQVRITRPLGLREVSALTGIKVSSIIQFLFEELDIVANINHVASIEEIELICEKFGVEYEVAREEKPEEELEVFADTAELHPVLRPPVVTVMGHVDHGKTKLLDQIRKTNVVDQESGGITQHIGAYQAEVNGRKITFIDTPGHEAFTAMRARGSQITDIVILVVAADDGVMPQTIEALEHAKAAGVPVIVAVNKIDKPDANPEKVRHSLAKAGVVPEEWGGDTVFVNISALNGQGISNLLEMILLQSEIMDLKSDPKAPPFGVVLESQIDPGFGVLATILVQQGTFEKGMFLLTGESVAKVRIMFDEFGKEVERATPSTPVRIAGFEVLPENGDKVYGFKDKRKAELIALGRKSQREQKELHAVAPKVSLDDLFNRIREGELKELQLVVKVDVQGSEEAVRECLQRLNVEGAKVRVIRAGVGQISESDVMLASASNAVIIGFRVGSAPQAKKLAEQEKVQIRTYEVIYKLVEDVELALKGLLEPEIVETLLGTLEIRAIFRQERGLTVAGGMVLSGKIQRGSLYRVKRNGTVVHEGQISSLKRFKDDVREVSEGFECGVLFEGTDQIKEGDIAEFYIQETRSPLEPQREPTQAE